VTRYWLPEARWPPAQWKDSSDTSVSKWKVGVLILQWVPKFLAWKFFRLFNEVSFLYRLGLSIMGTSKTVP